MKKLALLLLLLGCGDDSQEKLRACGAKAREHVALEGCQFRSMWCREESGNPHCEAQMACGEEIRTLTETCITVELGG